MNATKTTFSPPFKRLFNGSRTNTLWTTGANAAITFLNIAVGLVVARHFSTEDYGQLSYFVNLFGALRLLAAFGMTSQIAYELARARGQNQPIAPHFYPLLLIRAITLAGLTLLATIIGLLRSDTMLIVAGVAAMLALLSDYGIGALQGLGRVRRVVALLALQPAIYAIGVLWLLAASSAVQAIYLAYLLSYVPTIVLAAVWLYHSIGLPRLPLRPIAGIAALLRFAGTMYVLAIAGTLFTSCATLYLGAVGRFADAALITIPLNLVFTVSVLANTTMTTVYFPRITTLNAQGNEHGAQQAFTSFYSLVSGASLLVALVLACYPHAILGFLYGARYQASAPLLSLLAPVAYFYTTQTVATFTIVTQRKSSKALVGATGSVVLLVAGMAALSGRPDNLAWFAVAHSVASGVGLLQQLWAVGYSLRQIFAQGAKHFCVALLLIGGLRFLMPDTPNGLVVIVLLGILSLGYMAWLFHTTEGAL